MNIEHNSEYLFFPDFSKLSYYENPRNDNENLMNLQYKYLNGRSEKAWTELWSFAVYVSKKMVRDFYRKRKLFHNSSDVYDKAIEATEYVLRRYKKNLWYCCTKNLSSQLFLAVKHVFDYEYQTKSGKLEIEIKKLCIEKNISYEESLELLAPKHSIENYQDTQPQLF